MNKCLVDVREAEVATPIVRPARRPRTGSVQRRQQGVHHLFRLVEGQRVPGGVEHDAVGARESRDGSDDQDGAFRRYGRDSNGTTTPH